MTELALRISPFDIRNASDADYLAFYRFWSLLRAELLPNDPIPSADAAIRSWRNQPDFLITNSWVARRAGGPDIVARGQETHATTSDNRDLAEFTIHVLPEARRQGVGRQLLTLIARSARAADRLVLVGDTSGRVPAGIAFMNWIGARKGLETVINQLSLRELKPNASAPSIWPSKPTASATSSISSR